MKINKLILILIELINIVILLLHVLVHSIHRRLLEKVLVEKIKNIIMGGLLVI